MEKETIALIELGGSHDECLYSQVLFLKKYGLRVQVILFEDHLSHMDPYPEVDVWKSYKKPGGWLAEWILVFRLLTYLRCQGINKAVLNTAEGNLIRKLSLAAGRHTTFTGIIHLSSKLWTSRSQKIISRKVSKYFVLADFIKENLEKSDTGVSIESFYPIYFPAGKAAGAVQDQDYQICIPGAVDFARRDYQSLLDEMLSTEVPSGVKFVLLGRTSNKDGQELKARIRELGLEKHFTLFDGFIPHEEFYKHLKKAWLVLPLITPRCKDYADYIDYKITGSFNLAYGFGRPMLQHESFTGTRIYRETSVFYRDGGLLETLNQCMKEIPV
jgi:glycosyltransferase involved in cell wall biosynthesis